MVQKGVEWINLAWDIEKWQIFGHGYGTSVYIQYRDLLDWLEGSRLSEGKILRGVSPFLIGYSHAPVKEKLPVSRRTRCCERVAE